MAERARLFAATGDAVARISVGVDGCCQAELSLEGSGAGCLALDPHDPARLYVGTFDDGVCVSDDGGERWRTPDSGPADRRVLSLAVSAADRAAGESVVYAGTEPSNLYRSEDAGRSWRVIPSLRELPSEPTWSFPGRPWTHHVRTIALHPADPGLLLVGVELGGVMRSTDRGASWADHNPEAHSDAHRLLTHSRAPERVYEAAGQGVATSEDRGLTWTSHEEGLDRRYAWAAAIDAVDPDLWYVAISRGPFAAHGDGDGQARVMRRSDGGWSAVADWGETAPLRRMPYALATLPDRPRSLVAGLRGGLLLLSEDAGESWSELVVQLPDLVDLVAAPTV
jgi:photosystem II stability/assembly factor-like uncharacterized protein